MAITPGAATNDPRGYTWADAAKSVGEGWHALLRPIFVSLERGAPGTIAQVKEKFGTLRIYGDQLSPLVRSQIQTAEYLSGATCESCGHWGRTGGGGWIQTTCLLHGLARTPMADLLPAWTDRVTSMATTPPRAVRAPDPDRAATLLDLCTPFRVEPLLDPEAWGPRARLEEALACHEIPAETRQGWLLKLWDTELAPQLLARLVAALGADLGPLGDRLPATPADFPRWGVAWGARLRQIGDPRDARARQLVADAGEGTPLFWHAVGELWHDQPGLDDDVLLTAPLDLRATLISHAGLSAAQVVAWWERETVPMLRDRLLLHPACPLALRMQVAHDPATEPMRRLLLVGLGALPVSSQATALWRLLDETLQRVRQEAVETPPGPGRPPGDWAQIHRRLVEGLPLLLEAPDRAGRLEADEPIAALKPAFAPWFDAARGETPSDLAAPGLERRAARDVLVTLLRRLPPDQLQQLDLAAIQAVIRPSLMETDRAARERAIALVGHLGSAHRLPDDMIPLCEPDAPAR